MSDVLTREQLERIRDDIPSEFHLGAPYRLARTALAYLDRAEKAEAKLDELGEENSEVWGDFAECTTRIATLEAERDNALKLLSVCRGRFCEKHMKSRARVLCPYCEIETLEAELAQAREAMLKIIQNLRFCRSLPSDVGSWNISVSAALSIAESASKALGVEVKHE